MSDDNEDTIAGVSVGGVSARLKVGGWDENYERKSSAASSLENFLPGGKVVGRKFAETCHIAMRLGTC